MTQQARQEPSPRGSQLSVKDVSCVSTMTSQVEFFCSVAEEAAVIGYLSKSGAVFCDLVHGRIEGWVDASELEQPQRDKPWFLLSWVQVHGKLVWHESRPDLRGDSHGGLVASLQAQQEWMERALSDGDRLLDTDASPVVFIKRPGKWGGQWAPSSILAAPSNLERVGEAYARLVHRVMNRVRRQGKIVHDYRTPSARIPNPLGLLNTIYALPDVQESLDSHPEEFVIMSS